MNLSFKSICQSALLILTGVASASESRLLLPEHCYAVPGINMNVYFRNVFRAIRSDGYFYQVECEKGDNMKDRWTFTPADSDIGTYDWKLTVYDDNGKVAQGSMKLHVVPDRKERNDLSILIIGDSLTDQNHYVNRLHSVFPSLKMIGSHAGGGKTPVAGGIAHEGYGGWAWYTFVREVKPVKPQRLPYRTNKFLREQSDGKWVLDMKSFFDRFNGGKAPDFVTIQLGGNDVIADTDATIDGKIRRIGASMDKLIGEIRKAAPDAFIGIGLMPPAADQDAWGKGYHCNYNLYQYQKNAWKLNRFYMEKVKQLAQKDPRISIIPGVLNMDALNNFPAVMQPINVHNPRKILRQNNALHPAREGGAQLGDTFFCWIMWNLNAEAEKGKTNEN